jgi:hypothetical protein
MSDETKIIQKAALGSDTTQIAEQNNYYGMTAEEASNLAIKLFMDNFPRLQEEAKTIAKERAEELCKDKLEKQGKTNFSEFSDPDIQYILNKSYQEYARFGTQTLHDLLSNLIVNRINYDNDYYMKILLDEAVEIVKSLSEVHLNYLSLIFLCKETMIKDINSIESLKEHCEYICSKMPVTNEIESSVPFLNMLRLLTISLGSAAEVYSKRYNLDIGKVKEILPLAMNSIPGDYSLTPVGIIIAIVNIHNKTNLNLDFKIWIKSV